MRTNLLAKGVTARKSIQELVKRCFKFSKITSLTRIFTMISCIMINKRNWGAHRPSTVSRLKSFLQLKPRCSPHRLSQRSPNPQNHREAKLEMKNLNTSLSLCSTRQIVSLWIVHIMEKDKGPLIETVVLEKDRTLCRFNTEPKTHRSGRLKMRKFLSGAKRIEEIVI